MAWQASQPAKQTWLHGPKPSLEAPFSPMDRATHIHTKRAINAAQIRLDTIKEAPKKRATNIWPDPETRRTLHVQEQSLELAVTSKAYSCHIILPLWLWVESAMKGGLLSSPAASSWTRKELKKRVLRHAGSKEQNYPPSWNPRTVLRLSCSQHPINDGLLVTT